MAYRSLTHPSSKEKRVNDAIFRILGIAIKQYRHSVAFPIQIVETMDREEATVAPIANGILYLNDELGERSSVMRKLLTELIDKMNANPSQILSKNLSQFIAEIGAISPELSLQCLDMAHDLLNVEVRRHVLAMIRRTQFQMNFNAFCFIQSAIYGSQQSFWRNECYDCQSSVR